MLEALGNIGDFVGGLAVIATLLYLAIQVRQNTKLLRFTAQSSAIEADIAFNRLIGSDPRAARVFQVGLEDFASLSDEERRQFLNLLRAVFTSHQHVFQQFERGLVEQQTWYQYRNATLHLLALPHVSAWWNHRKGIYIPSFVDSVDSVPPVEQGTLAAEVIASMLEALPGTVPPSSQ